MAVFLASAYVLDVVCEIMEINENFRNFESQ